MGNQLQINLLPEPTGPWTHLEDYLVQNDLGAVCVLVPYCGLRHSVMSEVADMLRYYDLDEGHPDRASKDVRKHNG